MSDIGELSWFTVRCVFGSVGDAEDEMTYEERITLWQAGSADEAIERAEAEAIAYAASIDEVPVTYLGLAQCFHLFDSPEDGAEVFSLMRDSDLEPDDYLDTYFDSGDERVSNEAD